jgi:hypothetical protein
LRLLDGVEIELAQLRELVVDDEPRDHPAPHIVALDREVVPGGADRCGACRHDAFQRAEVAYRHFLLGDDLGQEGDVEDGLEIVETIF